MRHGQFPLLGLAAAVTCASMRSRPSRADVWVGRNLKKESSSARCFRNVVIAPRSPFLGAGHGVFLTYGQVVIGKTGRPSINVEVLVSADRDFVCFFSLWRLVGQ